MLGAGAALAQQQDQKLALRKLCADDYKKLCIGVAPGGGRIRDCMLSNIDKLTPQCRAGVEDWKKSKEKS